MSRIPRSLGNVLSAAPAVRCRCYAWVGRLIRQKAKRGELHEGENCHGHLGRSSACRHWSSISAICASGLGDGPSQGSDLRLPGDLTDRHRKFDVPFLHIDGRQLTRIRMGGYVPIAVSPGQHKLTTTESLFGSDTGKIRGQAIVTVPAGATVYLRYSETFKTFEPVALPKGVYVNSTGNYRFEPVAASEAKSEMSGMTRLGR